MLQIASKALVLLTATNFVAHVRVSAFSNPGSSLLGRQPTTGRLPRREADAFRVARNVNPLVLRVASNDGSSSENRAGASAKGAGPVDATVVSTTSSRTSSSLGGSSGKDPNSTGWLAKLRALPAVTKSTLVALFAALAQLASARKWRSALTPGRGNGNGGNNPFARLLNKLPAKQQLLVRRLAVPVASIALFTALNLGGSHAPKPPPPREVSYSEFFRVVEKSPKAFHGGVLMGSGRWDFAVTLPVEHPLPGMPLASVTPEAAAAATTLNKATPTGTAAAAANAAAAAGSKAPLPTRVSSEASPKGSGTSSLPSSATTDAAAATVRGSGYKAVRLYTRPVGPTNQPLPSDVLALLLKQEVNFMARPPAALGAFSKILFPVAYLALVFYFYNKTMGGNSAGNVGSRVEPGALPAGSGFEGVAGLGPAKFEVAEIVNMLRDPARYVQMGARLPAGILLVGPPGTGKTLLARAVAAEAGVPFYTCSGSDFVEMFVGRGAARVRQLFAAAKKAPGPAIIFVDELDAMGRARSTGNFGGISNGNAEAEQTLNQLLACMDGLDTSNDGVLVIGATNRYNLLDDALVRSGRFDRVVKVQLPDEAGRKDILAVHARKLNLGEPNQAEATLALAAAITPGASGAELASLANEAAIRAVRSNRKVVEAADFADAVASSNASRGNYDAGGLVGSLIKDALGFGNSKKPSSARPST